MRVHSFPIKELIPFIFPLLSAFVFYPFLYFLNSKQSFEEEFETKEDNFFLLSDLLILKIHILILDLLSSLENIIFFKFFSSLLYI